MRWRRCDRWRRVLVSKPRTTDRKNLGGSNMHDIVGFSSVHKNAATVDEHADLAALSATIRTAHASVTLAATNLVEHALAAGDALIAAKAALKIDVGHGHWLAWRKNE